MKEKGDVFAETGLMIPPPLLVIFTVVALPPNILLLIVTADVPHVFPFALLKLITGGLEHPHDTENSTPEVVHPDAFLTLITWVPLSCLVNDVVLMCAPPSKLYS